MQSGEREGYGKALTSGDLAGGKIIGGVFGLGTTLVDAGGALPGFLAENNLFLANATSALALLIRHLQPGQVWLPSYLCVALAIAARHGGSPVRFYPVSYDLDLQSSSWLDQVRLGDVVVMIDYFGFPMSLECADMVRSRGAWVVEDAAQALLTDGAGGHGDFAIFSPRKFLGVPDGGILLFNHPLDTTPIRLEPPPADWWLEALNAAILRQHFDVHGGRRDWFDLFQQAQAHAPVGAFRISELSRLLLATCFDYAAIRRRRIANFDRLAAGFADIALFPTRPAGVAPLAFPIRVKNRDSIRESLFSRCIYPPIHWALDGVVPESFVESHRLSSEVLSLPCDQRYDEGDMDRMTAALHEAIQGAHGKATLL
jgi:dTDP-4-amino-4,6-dideoxygalactose transaminase